MSNVPDPSEIQDDDVFADDDDEELEINISNLVGQIVTAIVDRHDSPYVDVSVDWSDPLDWVHNCELNEPAICAALGIAPDSMAMTSLIESLCMEVGIRLRQPHEYQSIEQNQSETIHSVNPIGGHDDGCILIPFKTKN